MLNENVKKLLKENMWDLATCSAGVPNAVPVAYKDAWPWASRCSRVRPRRRAR